MPARAQAPSVPAQQQAEDQVYGNISGTVVDASGAAVAGAQIKLTSGNQPPEQEILTGENGQFSFDDIAPGPIELTIAAAGFATLTLSRVLQPGAFDIIPQITLAVAANVTEVRVAVPRTEIAEAQIKVQEKQMVLGFMPNFYVSYVPDAAPLDAKQKYELAWKTLVNPFTFAWTAGVAGIEQAHDQFPGYGPGAQGYVKRYGAAFADNVSGTMIGAAIFPALLKQDPRYFYKGSGSTRSRILYALASSVLCKGDNGRWQANYSGILGSLAAGGISNLYYPASDRNGAGLTFENTAIGIGETSLTNLFQEFLVRKFTPHARGQNSANP